jgi:hypothetical protein
MLAMSLARVTRGRPIPAKNVLAHRDRLEVFWVDARGVAAEVIQRKPLGDWTNEELIRDPMHVEGLPVKPTFANPRVTTTASDARVEPATVLGLLNP